MAVLDPIASSFAHTDTSTPLATHRIHPNLQGEQNLAAALVKSLNDHPLTTAP